MNALKKRNPLTESFLVQLDVDFEALASRIPKLKNAFPRGGESVSIQRTGISAEANAVQPEQLGIDSPRIVCDDPDNVKGIFSYRKTEYSKDDNAKQQPVSEPSGMGLPGSAAFGGQAWLSMEQHLGGRLRSAGNSGHISSFGEMNGESTESPDGQDTGPTPNSSNASDGRLAKQGGAANGQMFGSTTSPQMMASAAHAGFFSASQPPYHMPQQQQPQQQPQQQQHMGQSMPYGMNGGWDNTAAQQAANMQNEGVLRALMNMGPMEAMDLSSWDTGNEPMRG